MKNFVISFITLILLISCGNSGKNGNNSDLQKVSVYFANAHMDIPKSYRLVSPDQMEVHMSKSGQPEDMKTEYINLIEEMKRTNLGFLIYADSADFDNNIWFMHIDKVPLTKTSSQAYLGMLEQNLKSRWTPLGVKCQRVESTYSAGAGASLLKIKYRLTKGNFAIFATQYIISTKDQMLGIMVNSPIPEDYQDLVTKMTFR